jgi:predicted RNase H-like nuclease (RuvC/YqgF family)
MDLVEESPDEAFDRIRPQLEAIQELRLWRAARLMTPEPPGCPPRPRVLRQMLSRDEEDHVRACPYCTQALKSVRYRSIKGRFERLERRWQEWKQTRPSLYVRMFQGTTLAAVMVALALLVSYSMFAGTRRLLVETQYRSETADAAALAIANVTKERDDLRKSVAELHTTINALNERSKRYELRQRDVQWRLQQAGDELKTVRADRAALQQVIRALADQGITVILSDQGATVRHAAGPRFSARVGPGLGIAGKARIRGCATGGRDITAVSLGCSPLARGQ